MRKQYLFNRFIALLVLILASNLSIAQINGTTNVCAGQTENYTSNASAATYQWTVTGARNFTPNGSEVVVEWGNAGTGTVSVESFDVTNNFLGTSNANITINGQPNAFFTSNFSTNTCPDLPRDSFPEDCFIACLSTPVIYTAPLNTGVSYTWQLIGDGSFIALSNNEIEVIWTSLGLQTIRLTASNGNGCSSAFEKCIEVVATPTALIGSSRPDEQVLTVCKNAPIFLEDKSTNSTGRRWDFGDGNSSNKINPTHSYDQAGTYQVVLTANNACFCIDTDTLTVIVEDAKAPEIICPAVVCGSDTVSYSTPAACSGFLWTAVNGTIVGSNTSNTVDVVWNNHVGYIQLEVTSCNNVCSAPATERIAVLVDNIPIQGPSPVCKNEEVEYFVNPVPGSVYTWNIPSSWTLIEDNDYRIKVSVKDAGTISVNYTNSLLGCSGSSSLNVSVSDVLAFAIPERFCSNDFFTYNFSAPIDWTVFDASGQIVFSDSNSATVEMNYGNLSSGNYTLQVGKRTSFCNDLQFQFEVLPAPTAPTTIYGDDMICESNAYSYSVDPRSGYRVEWEITGGMPASATGTNVTVNWNPNVSNYEVRAAYHQLEGPNCLSDFTAKTIGSNNTVTPTIVAADSVCGGDTARFGLNFSPDRVEWKVLTPDGASILTDRFQNEITLQFSAASSQTIRIRAETFICGVFTPLEKDIYIQSFPTPSINFSNPSPCPNVPVIFTTNASNPVWEIDNINYSNTIPFVSFNEAKSVNVKVTATYNGPMGCSVDRVNIGQLKVKDAPKAFITAFDTNTNRCMDTIAPVILSASLQGQSGGSGYVYNWSYEGNPISASGSSYTTGSISPHGSYTVAITAPNGCQSLSNPYVIDSCSTGGNPACPRVETANPPINVNVVLGNSSCTDFFVDQVQLSNGTLIDIRLQDANIEKQVAGPLGVGFRLVAGRHNLQFVGEVEYNSITYCFETTVFQFVQVEPDFIAVKEECSPTGLDRYQFINNSTYASSTPFFTWNFGAGTPITPFGTFDPIVEFPAGTHNITLSANGCSITKTITADPALTAAFSSTAPICQQEVVEFMNQSVGNIVEYKWQLGNQVVFDENAKATFVEQNGNLTATFFPTIELVVLDQNGCRDSIEQDIRIEGNKFNGSVFPINNPSICEGDSIRLFHAQQPFTFNNNTPLNYIWSDQSTTTDLQVKQTGNYRLSITDNVGCRYVTNTVNIQVDDAPDPLIIGKNVFCADEPVKLSTLAHNSQTINWNRNGNFTGITGAKYEEMLLPQIYQISINATNNITGCTSINTPHTVTVLNSVSTPNIMASGNSLCEGVPISLTASPNSGNFYWNTGQTGNSITQSLAGRYTVYQTDANGCQATNFIDIHPLPDPDNFITGCYCIPSSPLQFLTGIPNMASYQWIKNGINVPPSLAGNAQNTLATEGAFELIATTGNGCIDTLGVLDITIDGCGPCNISATDFSITCAQVMGDSIVYNYSINASIDNVAAYRIHPIVSVNGTPARIISSQPDSVVGNQNTLTGAFVIANATVGDSICIQLTASNPGVNCTTEVCTAIEPLACDFTPDIAVDINPYSCEAQFSSVALFGSCVNSDSVLYSWTITQNGNTYSGSDSTIVITDLETGAAQVCLNMQVFNSIDSSFCSKDTCITVFVPDCSCNDDCEDLSINSVNFVRFIPSADSCIQEIRVVIDNPNNVFVSPNFVGSSIGEVISIVNTSAGANQVAFLIQLYRPQGGDCQNACFELFLNNGGTDCCLNFCVDLPACTCNLTANRMELNCSDPNLQNGQIAFGFWLFADDCMGFDYSINNIVATVDGMPVNIVSSSPSIITNGRVFVSGVVDLMGQTGSELCIDVNAGVAGNNCTARVCAELPSVECDLEVDFETILNPEACTVTLINRSTSNPCISIDSTDIEWTIDLNGRTITRFGDTVKLSNISGELIQVCMRITSTDITGNTVCEGEVCQEIEVPICECSRTCEGFEVIDPHFDQFVSVVDSCIIRFQVTIQDPANGGFDLCAMLSEEGQVVSTSVVSSSGGITTYAVDFYPNQNWMGGTACFTAYLGLPNGANCCQEFCVELPSCNCNIEMDAEVMCLNPDPNVRTFSFSIPINTMDGGNFNYTITSLTATLNGNPILIANYSPSVIASVDTITGQFQALNAMLGDTICFTLTTDLGGKICNTTVCTTLPDQPCQVNNDFSWSYDQTTCTLTITDQTTADACTYLFPSEYFLILPNDTIRVDTTARQYSFTNITDSVVYFCVGTDGLLFDGSSDCGDSSAVFAFCDSLILPPCNTGGLGNSPLAREKNEQLQQAKITTYPNPTKDKLIVEWDKVMDENIQVSLLNQNGEIVYQEQRRLNGNQLELNLSNYADGVYVLEITQVEFVYREKVILLK